VHPLRLVDDRRVGSDLTDEALPHKKSDHLSTENRGILKGILYRLGSLFRAISSAIGRLFGFVPRQEDIDKSMSGSIQMPTNGTANNVTIALSRVPVTRTIWSFFRPQRTESSVTTPGYKPDDNVLVPAGRGSFFPHDSVSKTDTYISRDRRGSLTVDGEFVTKNETDALAFVIQKRNSISPKSSGSGGVSPWLWEASEIELLRFVRAHHGYADLVWSKVLAHAKWRVSEYGADTVVRENKFEHSMLNHELFWWGENKEGCPTLIIRTRAHDGKYYDEDPRIFTR
jgi:hypothetical protein